LSGFYLGSGIDGEGNGQPSSQANGDDLASVDDDDGVSFVGAIVAGQTATVDIVVHNGGRGSGIISAWMDFNADGDFDDAGEKILGYDPSKPVVDGVNRRTFAVPAGAKLGNTFAR